MCVCDCFQLVDGLHLVHLSTISRNCRYFPPPAVGGFQRCCVDVCCILLKDCGSEGSGAIKQRQLEESARGARARNPSVMYGWINLFGANLPKTPKAAMNIGHMLHVNESRLD